jgi:hypothetical protein
MPLDALPSPLSSCLQKHGIVQNNPANCCTLSFSSISWLPARSKSCTDFRNSLFRLACRQCKLPLEEKSKLRVQMASMTYMILLWGEPEKEHRALNITKPLPPTKGEGWDVPAQPFSILYIIREERRGRGRVSKGEQQILQVADVNCWFLGGSTDSSVTEPYLSYFCGTGPPVALLSPVTCYVLFLG